ncbi:MAG: M20/M25/M40 family metallo-hydrolase [Alphaproteobacteria bacterium]|nr:M20/M25/M40 family metallo-hydrolase [Alphaproteobacteria bacterium]
MIWALLLACSPAPSPLSDAAVADAVAAGAQVDGDRLMALVTELVEVRAGERGRWFAYWEKPHVRALSAAWCTDQLSALGLAPQQHRTVEDAVEAENVWVDLPGTTRPEEILLVTAHHDSWFQGADDNASGVAVLLELARILSAEPAERTVRLAFFDQEETGATGSRRFFRDFDEDGIIGVINLDSVGYADPTPGAQSAPPGFRIPDTGDFLAAIANDPAAEPLAHALQLAEALDPPAVVAGALGPGDAFYGATRDFHRSDHGAAWREGLPGVFFTDTTNFRNPHYHQETDLPETLDPAFLEDSGRVVVALTRAWGDAP